MGISTVPSALRATAEDLILRARHVEEMDARLQAADALLEAAKMAHTYFGEHIRVSPSQIAAALSEAIDAYETVGNLGGIKLKVDASLQPGEWQIRK